MTVLETPGSAAGGGRTSRLAPRMEVPSTGDGRRGEPGRPRTLELCRAIEVLEPVQVVSSGRPPVHELAYDARTVEPGTLFFCVRGARSDGHAFAGEALSRGAAALVVEEVLDLPAPQLVVQDARAAMAVVADEFFGRPTEELAVAGVTGTNGKTTTAYLLHSILETAGRRPGLLGNVERRVGGVAEPSGLNTPEAIDLQRLLRRMLDAGDRSCALEASSHASALHRLDRVRFAVLVFTNLTQDHLDFHGTMEDYFEAKQRLFHEHDLGGAAIDVDGPYGRRLARSLGRRAVTFGFSDEATFRPERLELDPAGTRFRVDGVEVRTHLRGRFNVENALGAYAAASLLGIDGATAAAGIERLGGVPGRLEPVDEGQPFTVLVDYAHTPDSLAGALRAARELSPGRLICVFGCGGERDRGKRPLMGRLAAEFADRAIVTSDNPRGEDPLAIVAEILAGAAVGQLEVEPDRRAAIERAVGEAAPGDVVLIAGKGHEGGQQVGEETFPFDDRRVAREALAQGRR